MQQTVINSRECIFACRLAQGQSRPDNLYLLGLCCCGPLLMTPMCAVARRNAVLQEDKALFARFSRPGVLETCVGRLLCIWHWRIRKEGRVINQGNDRHQGKVPTHCQVSLSAVDKLIKSGHMAPSGLPLFSAASVLLLPTPSPHPSTTDLASECHPCDEIFSKYCVLSWPRSIKRGEKCLKFKLKAFVRWDNPSWVRLVI